MLNRVKEEHLKNKPEGCFLADVFLMCNLKEIKNSTWQLDYYNPETKKITSHLIQQGEIQDNQESFKDPNTNIQEIDLNKVNVEFKEALETAKAELSKYPDTATKIVAILQTLEGISTWNISFITTNFFLHNTKVNAETGDIIKTNYSSLLSFKAE